MYVEIQEYYIYKYIYIFLVVERSSLSFSIYEHLNSKTIHKSSENVGVSVA